MGYFSKEDQTKAKKQMNYLEKAQQPINNSDKIYILKELLRLKQSLGLLQEESNNSGKEPDEDALLSIILLSPIVKQITYHSYIKELLKDNTCKWKTDSIKSDYENYVYSNVSFQLSDLKDIDFDTELEKVRSNVSTTLSQIEKEQAIKRHPEPTL